MFMAFIETGHNHLLKHPLCESFLHLKWLKVRKFFFVSLAFHLIFTMLHTTFVILVYSNQCIIRDNCRHGPDTDFQDISRLENHRGQSVSGDCFVPYEERCKITIETIVVWVLLIMSTAGTLQNFRSITQHSERISQMFMFYIDSKLLGATVMGCYRLYLDLILKSFAQCCQPRRSSS